MGCGAAKAAQAQEGPTSEEVRPISTSITQIRDIAPLEVADTGAHPPLRRNLPVRQNLYYQEGTEAILSLPGVVPEVNTGTEISESSARRRGESLIKMHPPKKPQRLGEEIETLKIKQSSISESKAT